MEGTPIWTDVGSPTTSEQSSEQAHGGTYSWKTVGSSGQGIRSEVFRMVAGKTYDLSVWLYRPTTAYQYRVTWYDGDGSTLLTNLGYFGGAADTWVERVIQKTSTVTGDAAYVEITLNGSGTIYWDDVTITEV